jgi:hypothetical protein
MTPFSNSTNKGSNNLTQSYPELNSDFFDQFMTFDPIDIESPDYSILPPTFDEDLTDDDRLSGAIPSKSTEGELKDLDNLVPLPAESFAASFNVDLGSYLYAEASGRAATSDTELLSLENITLESPQIPQYAQSSPPSPSAIAGRFLQRKNRIAESFSKTLRKATKSFDKSLLRSPIKKPSSKMLHTHYSNHSQELWERKLSRESAQLDFNLDTNILPISPPESTETFNTFEASSSLDQKETQLSSTQMMPILQPSQPNMEYHTPIATPTLEQHQTPRTSYHTAASSSPFPITPRGHRPSVSWPQFPLSKEFHPYRISQAYPEMDGSIWWNHAATAPMAQPSPSGYYTNPQRATKSLVAMQLQNDLHYSTNEMAFDSLNMSNGLMIQMPNSPGRTSCLIDVDSPSQQQGYFPSHQSRQRHHHRHQEDEHPYHARIRQPRSHIEAQLQSPPKLRQSRSRDSDCNSPCPNSPSLQVRKRKSAKAKASKSSGAQGPVDFVNFTPSDSRKILTGVAPSGSSKTKARREKEALEKRRKLSQAAVRAVRAVGGDVESLIEQGLLV